jgi:hypothetical protein
VTIAAPRRRANRDKDNVRFAYRLRKIGRKDKSACARVGLNNAVQIGLEYRNFAAL